ncbi:MAG: hypothetical protein IJ825_07375, partial [Oscillospiraceae bacterium]|nr:hypothetical protein [Oscillospiraceae bacterium]
LPACGEGAGGGADSQYALLKTFFDKLRPHCVKCGLFGLCCRMKQMLPNEAKATKSNKIVIVLVKVIQKKKKIQIMI